MTRTTSLPIPRLLLVTLVALSIAIVAMSNAARAESVNGAIEKVTGEGRMIVIDGKFIEVSGSRSNVCIAGVCDQPRAKLKAGMNCMTETAERGGKVEARKLSCK